MRPVLIVTALPCEAAPLIAARNLKPVRGLPLFERFQVASSNEGTFVAITGVGKLKSAAATAALGAALLKDGSPIIANFGIAGAPLHYAPLGTPFLVNKVRDAASNTRFYPDILVRHPFAESHLETHDSPVSSPPAGAHLFDMEASGFMQAATLLVAPSEIAIIKIVSDFCEGNKLSPSQVSTLISPSAETTLNLIDTMRTEIVEPVAISESERLLLDKISLHAHFSLNQRLEINRAVISRKAKEQPFLTILESVLDRVVSSKAERSALYRTLLASLQEEPEHRE
jgi:hypothetical protein